MSKQKLQAFQDLPLNREFCGSPSVGLDLWLVTLFIYSLRAPGPSTFPHHPNECEMWEEGGNLFFVFCFFLNAYLAVLTLLDRSIKCCEISAL